MKFDNTMARLLPSLISLFIILLPSSIAEGRKIGYKLPSKETVKEKAEKGSKGTFKVEIREEGQSINVNRDSIYSDTPSDARYSRENIKFTGFDKKLNSNSESFFITNKTQHLLTGVDLTIDYLTPDGRQLHKKFYHINCNIPVGETRKTDIKSWDTQRSFYYVKSAPTRADGSPFIVKFYPSAIYLKY